MIEDIEFKPILEKAGSRGGELAELFVEERIQTEILLEAGKIEQASIGISRGAGVRLLCESRTRYAYTNSLLKNDLLSLAEAVSQSADTSQPAVIIPMEFQSPKTYFKPEILIPPDQIPLGEKIKLLKKAEETARKYHKSIVQVRVRYFDLRRKIGIANSNGILARDETVQTLFLVQVIAEKDGELQVGYEPVGGTQGFELFKEYPPEQVALTSAQRAVKMLKARKAPGGKMPVVLSAEAGGTMIHEAIGHGLEADLAEQGLSVYQNKLGKEVASKLITVVDDATIPGKRGSYEIDDEGTAGERTVLVEKGVLVNYMYNLLEAMRAGKKSTGNGRRESYRYPPLVRMSNTIILPGESSPEQIIRAVDFGLFVKKMGGGQVDTVSGDFIFEVNEGYLIEKGEVAEPVRGATLVGNGPQVLKEIDMVGNDLGFGIGTCGKDGQGVPVADAQPTLRIPELVVGGAVNE